MRKILIIVLIAILVAGLTAIVLSGMQIGGINLSSVKGIMDANKQLDDKISRLNTSISTDYVAANSNLEASLKKLQTSKEKYQETVTFSTEEEIKAANQKEKYEIGYLWTKIGLYATKNKIVMQANVSRGSTDGLYNISFTAVGEYIAISEFIYAIENDSTLGFKIEDFSLAPYNGSLASGSNLQATFSTRNIAIDKDSLNNAN